MSQTLEQHLFQKNSIQRYNKYKNKHGFLFIVIAIYGDTEKEQPNTVKLLNVATEAETFVSINDFNQAINTARLIQQPKISE